jgi:hypothetical protein
VPVTSIAVPEARLGDAEARRDSALVAVPSAVPRDARTQARQAAVAPARQAVWASSDLLDAGLPERWEDSTDEASAARGASLVARQVGPVRLDAAVQRAEELVWQAQLAPGPALPPPVMAALPRDPSTALAESLELPAPELLRPWKRPAVAEQQRPRNRRRPIRPGRRR